MFSPNQLAKVPNQASVAKDVLVFSQSDEVDCDLLAPARNAERRLR
jgi:hypothetical protein